MSFILRDLDPAFWARVQVKARAEGQAVKAVILRLLTQWLGVVAALVILTGCAPSSVAPTAVVLPPIPPARSIALLGGAATSSHQVLFNFTVNDAIGDGVAGQRVALTTTAGTLDYHLVVTGPSGSGQAILTTTEDATVTATMGDLSASADATAYVVSPAPPSTPPTPRPPSCATDPSLCPPAPTCATDPSLCPPARVLVATMTCTPAPHAHLTQCNINLSYGGAPISGGVIRAVDWNWGDGEHNDGSTTPVYAHTYAIVGTFRIFVTVMAETVDGTRFAETSVMVSIE